MQRLLTRYPDDQYLIIKKARLLSKMREFEELEAHIKNKEGLVLEEKLEMNLRLIDYECFYGRAKYKEALGL